LDAVGIISQTKAEVFPFMAHGLPIKPIVRQARFSDWAAINRFIDTAYGALAPWKGTARRKWQFLDNPFQIRSDDLAPIWIAVDGSDAVGQIAVQAASVQIDGVEHVAGWIVDVMILANHRGTGIGHRLHEAVAASVPLLVTLTMAPATRRMAMRAGCVTLAQTREFAKLVYLESGSVRKYLLSRTQHRPLLQTLARVACDVFQVHRLMAPIVNRYIKWLSRAKPDSGCDDKIELVEVKSFEGELDQFWNRVRRGYPAIFVRDSRFLNWRFVKSPDLHYRCFIARRSDECVGYLVLRRSMLEELPAGHIVDFLVAPGDARAFECLIAYASRIFGTDVAAISCVTSVPEFELSLQKLGFRAVRTVQATVVCRDPDLRARIDELKDDWYFTKGDHDWDQIHLAESGN
jgi:GNAT superfamily N-acetyltransferase